MTAALVTARPITRPEGGSDDLGLEPGRDKLHSIGRTPVLPVELYVRGIRHHVLLKLENTNPTGSIKDRTALSLIREAARLGQLTPRRRIVESSSGNLATALGFIARSLDLHFTAVVDPKLTKENRAKLERLGVEILVVEHPDDSGSYLLGRLAAVADLCAHDSRYYWTNQYGSKANPQAHFLGTGPEIWLQSGRNLDAVFVAASTGGTLAGVAAYLRQVSPLTSVVGVDAVGSVVFGNPPGPRHLVGIGASRQPEFPLTGLVDEVAMVSDEQAYRAVHLLAYHGVRLGGSSGAALHAAAEFLARSDEPQRVAVVCPDTGENYRSSIYSAPWLTANGFAADAVMQPHQLLLSTGDTAALTVPVATDTGKADA